MCLLSFFLIQGLVDKLVRHQGSVAAGKVSDAVSPATALLHFKLAARRHDPGQTHRVLNHLNHTHHTHHTQGSDRLLRFVLVTFSCAFLMSTNVGVDTTTAAARRRQRRLRSWLRHEWMTVAMLLAERDHHTAPRGQKQARSGGVEHEVNYEPRLLDPPLSQEAATVCYVAALVPSLSLPVLADRAAEVVDSSSPLPLP